MKDSLKERGVSKTIAGILFLLLGVAVVVVPQPTPFQYTVFRTMLALATARFTLPGFVVVRSKWLRAGGPVAVFVIVYFCSPAALIMQK